MKKSLSIVLAVVLLFCLAAPAFAFSAVRSAQSLTVNGQIVACDKYNIDGSNYFKLRDLAQLLNGTESQFDVGWDGDKGIVSITTQHPYTTPNGHELEIGEDLSSSAVVSSQTIMINGIVRTDLTVYNIGGSNFFKLREMGDALGFFVDYDGNTNTAIVESTKQLPGVGNVALSAEQISEKCANSVFLINVYNLNGTKRGSGSGFFITNDGLAVTNYHVLADARDVEVQTSDGKTYLDVEFVDANRDLDLALFRVKGISTVALPISDQPVKQGQTAFAIGSPLGLDNTISQGIISNPARTIDGSTYIQISVPIAPGSSGGALLNEYGEVIGITSAGFANSTGDLNLAIPVKDLEQLNRNGNLMSYIFSKDPYSGFNQVIDFGNLTGVRIVSANTTPLGYVVNYDMYDFHDIFGYDESTRYALSVAYYGSLLKENGMTLFTNNDNKTTYYSETEYVTYFLDYTNHIIQITFERFPQYYSDIDGLPDFGWFSDMKTNPSSLVEDSLMYEYVWKDYYSYNTFTGILNDYFDLLEQLDFTYVGGDDTTFLFESDSLSACFMIANTILYIDVRPVVNGQLGSFDPNAKPVVSQNSSRKAAAYKALTDFILTNYPSNVNGDVYGGFSLTSGTSQLIEVQYTIWDSVDFRVTYTYENLKFITTYSIYGSSDNVDVYYDSYKNGVKQSSGFGTINPANFTNDYTIPFSTYSGADRSYDGKMAATLGNNIVYFITTNLFAIYVSPENHYTAADFGFVNFTY